MRITAGDVFVFTYRQGLLSAMGHNLRLSVTRFEIELDDARRSVRASFDARSLVVDGAMVNGALDPGALGEQERADILEAVRGDVLGSDRYRRIELSATVTPSSAGWSVAGALTLRDRSREIRLALTRRERSVEGRLRLVPSRWGIEPYRALLGALRLQDAVDIAVKFNDLELIKP